MNISKLHYIFKIFTIIGLIIGFIYFLVLSLIVKDYKFIYENPLLFFIETLFMMILPALPLLFFYVSRKISWNKAMIYAGSLALKFGAFHIVFQLSGLYTYLFVK